MKVAMVGHKVIPSRRGGIENVLTSLCPLLVEKGIDVTCYNRSSDKVENEYVGTVENKKYRGVTLKNAWTVNARGISAMIASFTAAISAAFGRYDIVHFHAEVPGEAEIFDLHKEVAGAVCLPIKMWYQPQVRRQWAA